MRKNILLIFSAIVLSILLFSCKQKKFVRIEKPVTKIDVTIDTSNAFNPMFLDSAQVNAFLAADSLGDVLNNRIKSFYNSRNYQFAWFSPEGMPEHTTSFWNMLKNYFNYSGDSAVYNKKLSAKMEALLQKDTVAVKNDSTFKKLELLLTRYLYVYADHAYANNPNFDMKSLEWYIPRKKMTVEATLDSVLARKGQFAEANAPTNTQYKKLFNCLLKYKIIRDKGGFPVVQTSREILEKGDNAPEVKALKLRLKAEDFLHAPDSVLTSEYDSSLVTAVNLAKHAYGYKMDGKAGKTFINDLNVPIDERIQQILVNMERMRWIPSETNDKGRAIMVNIPDYKLHVYEEGKPAWEMDVVVGKEGHNTTVFTGNLRTVVFNPYWNVPPSIVKDEIMPHLKNGNGYLNRNHMEITGKSGGLPVIRQKPGTWNSLGVVKFLFPNSYNIYFHDSPAKSMFNKDKRSFSHGCVRLKEPKKFAEYLLDDTVKWNRTKIDSIIKTETEKFVPIKEKVPVLITYFTAWADDYHNLSLREDIYGHDEVVAKKMFLNYRETTRAGKKQKTAPATPPPVKKDTAMAKPKGNKPAVKDTTTKKQ